MKRRSNAEEQPLELVGVPVGQSNPESLPGVNVVGNYYKFHSNSIAANTTLMHDRNSYLPLAMWILPLGFEGEYQPTSRACLCHTYSRPLLTKLFSHARTGSTPSTTPPQHSHTHTHA